MLRNALRKDLLLNRVLLLDGPPASPYRSLLQSSDLPPQSRRADFPACMLP